MKKILPILMLSFLIFSCNQENSSKNNEPQTEKAVVENCTYAVDAEKLNFEWVAFKTTEKIAVKGTFDTIKAKNENIASSIPVVLTSTSFEIDLNSLNSKNVERDEKLKEFVFGNMANSELFTGSIEECDGDNNEGVLIVNLKMNDISKQVKMKYAVAQNEGGKEVINIKGALDLMDWEASKALDAINVACLDLHKGADGVSKTWSDMEINVSVPLLKDCK